MQWILVILVALFGVPAVYLLSIVYTSPAVDAVVKSRKLEIRMSHSGRRPVPSIFDMTLLLRAADGKEYTWQQQLPMTRLEEMLMFFDQYPAGKQTRIYVHKEDALLRRGLPDWRFGVGWGLAVFALVFLFFLFVSNTMSANGPWLLRPQRSAVLMGLVPVLFGYYLYQTLEAKIVQWPRVMVHVEEKPTLEVLDRRAPDLTLDAETRTYFKDSTLESIYYTFQGREYMYARSHDVMVYGSGDQKEFEKIVDPADPAALSEIPVRNDDKFAGAYICLGLGGIFLLLGLLIP